MYLYRYFSANNIPWEEKSFRRELFMEAYLIENEQILALDKDDFSQVEILDNELKVCQGRSSKNRSGRIDILASYPNSNTLGLIELKLGEINESHTQQLKDYLSKKEDIIESLNKSTRDELSSKELSWVGILVGETIDPDFACKVRSGLILNDVPIVAVTLKRFQSKDKTQNFVVSDIYVGNRMQGHDNSKVLFKGERFPKSRGVLRVVKDYVERYPDITYSQLRSKFPDKLQRPGNTGVIRELGDADLIYERTGRKRYFMNEDEVIVLQGGKVAVSNQWGIGNINNFIDHARDELEYEIKLVPMQE